MQKLKWWVLVFSICFTQACGVIGPAPDIPILERDQTNSNPLTGEVTGTAQVVYTLGEQTVTCTDDAANFQMSIARDGNIPADTNISGGLPKNQQYFRLNVTSVLRILDQGKCLERDPSDDRVITPIEGGYDGATYKFSAQTCSKFGAPTQSDIYLADASIVSGEVVCKVSDQMKYIFRFADLKLK